jgi:RNA polymerase sigma factor for flagellar operon FliA
MKGFRHGEAGALTQHTKEQESLLLRYQRSRSRKLRDRLLECYLPLVHGISRRILVSRNSTMDLDDLVGVGSLALFESLKRYDPKRGVRFSAFAAHRIRGAILDEFRKLNGAKRSSRGAVRYPGDDVDCRERASESETKSRAEALSEPASMPASEFESLDHLVDPKGSGSIDDLERREVIAHLTTSLSARERNILNLYYGRGITMREISKRIGLSVPRISALHSSILGRLQARFKELQHEVFS